jgi:hypothetical protein
MKKIFLFAVCGWILFSCQKEAKLPPGTLQMEGFLHYDNFPDGFGLYYREDFTNQLILFKDSFASDSAQYENYKQYVNVHTRLYYLDNGDTGCVYGIGRICPFPLVEPLRLVKE